MKIAIVLKGSLWDTRDAIDNAARSIVGHKYPDGLALRERIDLAFVTAKAILAATPTRPAVSDPFRRHTHPAALAAELAGIVGYAGVREETLNRALHLVIDAPAGPPRSTAEFLGRFSKNALLALWGADCEIERAEIASVTTPEYWPDLEEIRLAFAAVFRRAGWLSASAAELGLATAVNDIFSNTTDEGK